MEEEADYVPLIGSSSDLTPALGWSYSKYWKIGNNTVRGIQGDQTTFAKTEVSYGH